MKKKKKISLVMLLFACLFSLLMISTYLYITESNKQKRAYKISIIVYGSSTDRWATLKHGIEQGAEDFGAEVNFVTMKDERDSAEQIKLIDREIENGAKGIILAAADSEKLSPAVREALTLVPFVMVETNIINTEGLAYISADNYSMGLNIGRSILLNSNEYRSVAVYVNHFQRSSVTERYEGLLDSLQYSDCTLISWERDEDQEEELFLQNKIKTESVDVIIALDDSSLEAMVDAVLATDNRVELYGIGSTNKIVHYLDYGVIKSIVFQNEFNMGYLSLQEAINAIHKKENELNVEIEFRTVNRETMYLPKNQRLVFPIVQ